MSEGLQAEMTLQESCLEAMSHMSVEVRALIDKTKELEDENAKLRNEVANMYREMQGVLDMSGDTVWVDKIGTLRDHMDAHMESMRELGIQPPDYDQRMRELGIQPPDYDQRMLELGLAEEGE